MTVIVSGRTFDHKHLLSRTMGGHWNNDLKHWEFISLSKEHRAMLAQKPGVIVSEIADTPKPLKPPHISNDEIEKIIADALDRNQKEIDGKNKTHMYGDDPSFHNTFAHKNPIVYFGFSSLSKFADFIEATPDRIKKDNRRNSAWKIQTSDWTGAASMQDAIKLARNGWPDGVKLAEHIREKLVGDHALEKRRKYSVAGGNVNVGKMLSGNPTHMIHRKRQEGIKVITFFVEICMSGVVPAELMIIRAATIGAMVDILEMNGYSCEIVAVGTTTSNKSEKKPLYHMVTSLKQSGEPLNINDTIFGLGHPAFLRRFDFACCERDDDLFHWWSSKGYPASAFNKGYQPGPNQLFIDKLNIENINDLKRMETQDEKVDAIWKLIADPKLPIKLGE